MNDFESNVKTALSVFFEKAAKLWCDQNIKKEDIRKEVVKFAMYIDKSLKMEDKNGN